MKHVFGVSVAVLVLCFSRTLLCSPPQQPASAAQSPSTDAAQHIDSQGLIIYQTELEKPLSTKKSAVGDVVRVRTKAIEGRLRLPISEFIGHIIEIHPKGDDDKESRICLRFDTAIISGVEKPLPASIRAIASVDSARFGFSPANVDRYPCGEDEKCSKDKENQVETFPPALSGRAFPIFCRVETPEKSRKQRSVCSDLPRAEGVFGIDGLGLRPLTQDPDQGSVVASSKKNIGIDAGSYVILAVKSVSSDAAAGLATHP